MNYILSILIPTRNRLEYLCCCTQQVLNACSDKVQIIVQDNSDKEWDEAKDIAKRHPNFYYYYKKLEEKDI